LADKSLLVADVARSEPHFEMLGTVRDYALEQLIETGEAGDVLARHAAYVAALAEEAQAALVGPTQSHWLERLDREQANVQAALTWAQGLNRSRSERAALATNLNNLGRVALYQGEHGQARRFHEDSLSIRREIGDLWGQGLALSDLAEAVAALGDPSAARLLQHESLA